MVVCKDSDRILSRTKPKWYECQGRYPVASQLPFRTCGQSESSFNTLLRLELSSASPKNSYLQNADSFSNEIDLTPLVKSLLQPHTLGRSVSISPLKILDAPGLLDDFYLNLIDWAPKGGPVAVALGKSIVFIEDPLEKKSRSYRFASNVESSVTCISHSPNSSLATGTHAGTFILWDHLTGSPLITLPQLHAGRIGAISWRDSNVVTIGGRDKKIRHLDTRAPSSDIAESLCSHAQEVCGLAWDVTGTLLASGGNDNRLLVWDVRKMSHSSMSITPNPLYEWTDHNAAVKAISWCPSVSSLLVSGGGTLDRRLVLRDTSVDISNSIVSSIDTGSQVCNVRWSPSKSAGNNELELVTSHGYTQNQLVLWRVSPQFAYQTKMWNISNGKSISTAYNALTGYGIHTGCGVSTPVETLPPGARLTPLVHFKQSKERIVHMSVDPERGEHVVTGSGDCMLKFWSVFRPKPIDR